MLSYLLQHSGDHRRPLPFPTRRSSDLPRRAHNGAVCHSANATTAPAPTWVIVYGPPQMRPPLGSFPTSMGIDRKSTRLNSSHLVISYAVFCLKKKTSRHATACLSVSCQ